MNHHFSILAAGVILAASWLLSRGALCDEPTADLADISKAKVSLEVARDHATLLHDVYASTLHVMHRHYFHGDRAVVPARAMEDLFANMNRMHQVEARWIAVNLRR